MMAHFQNNSTNCLISFYLFIFTFALYFLAASDATVYDTDASIARYETTRAIVEKFDVALPDNLGVKGSDGRDYSWFGLGYPVLGVPFYSIGNYLGILHDFVSMMTHLFGAATVVLVFLFALSLGYSKRASLLTALFYGFGTMAWPLAKQPFDHTVETFFVLSSVYFIYRYVNGSRPLYLVLSSLAFGFAFITRYTSILVMPALCIITIVFNFRKCNASQYLRRSVKDLLFFSLIFIPFLLLTLWYNYYRFGSLFETGYSLIAQGSGLNFFAGTSILRGISGFLISPGKGFFYYSPVALLYFFSIKDFSKKHLEVAVGFITIIVLYLLFLSRNVYWHGDWAWGPRYLLVITPLLIIPAAEVFDSPGWFKKTFLRYAVLFLFVTSFLIQLAAVSVDFHKYFETLRLKEGVRFSKVGGGDIPYIVEPPPEVYFDWQRSPIREQFRFFFEIADKMNSYAYSVPPKSASYEEKTRMHPHMNVFDFWWLYRYVIARDNSGFLGVLALILLSTYSACKMRKAVA